MKEDDLDIALHNYIQNELLLQDKIPIEYVLVAKILTDSGEEFELDRDLISIIYKEREELSQEEFEMLEEFGDWMEQWSSNTEVIVKIFINEDQLKKDIKDTVKELLDSRKK